MAAETRGAGLGGGGGGGGGGEGNDRTTTRCTAPKHRTHNAAVDFQAVLTLTSVLTLHSQYYCCSTTQKIFIQYLHPQFCRRLPSCCKIRSVLTQRFNTTQLAVQLEQYLKHYTLE